MLVDDFNFESSPRFTASTDLAMLKGVNDGVERRTLQDAVPYFQTCCANIYLEPVTAVLQNSKKGGTYA